MITCQQVAIEYRYPDHAGAKERGGTSQDAALALDASGRTHLLRNRVLTLFRCGHRFTADEAAAYLGESILAIRPRCSELRALGKLVPTGDRRKSDGGRMAHVWRLA